MSQRNVETVLGRLATDPDLLHRFQRDPHAVIRELSEQGYALTSIEVEAVAGTESITVAALAARLDARIRRASNRDDLTLSPRATETTTPQTRHVASSQTAIAPDKKT